LPVRGAKTATSDVTLI